MGQPISGKHLWESQREKSVSVCVSVCVCVCVWSEYIAGRLVLYVTEIVSLLIKRWKRKAVLGIFPMGEQQD